jgi:UDP-GlcNAc:undecaprenyl-phosphate GlcNAc-1-phosphate transferase
VIVAALVVTAAISLIATPAARGIAWWLGILDRPGPRKVHAHAVARLGGAAVVLSATAGLAALAAVVSPGPLAVLGGSRWPILAGAALVFAGGLWDDLRGSSPATRLLVEVVAAALVIGSGATIDRLTLGGATYELGVASIPVTLAWILVVTNAFNLIDGLDGLAAGLAAIAAATCAAILTARGHTAEALVLVGLLGAVLGFLPYNFHPASIFLGDSGSLVIGFVLAVTAITGWQKGATVLALGVPLLIFAVPILDTVTAVARRTLRTDPAMASPGRVALGRVFEADQEHIHHRLMARGLSHRATVLLLYGLSLASSGLALLTFQRP